MEENGVTKLVNFEQNHATSACQVLLPLLFDLTYIIYFLI